MASPHAKYAHRALFAEAGYRRAGPLAALIVAKLPSCRCVGYDSILAPMNHKNHTMIEFRKVIHITLAFAMVSCALSPSASVNRGMDAYDAIQKIRRDAGAAASTGTADDLRRAATMLEGALTTLADADVMELGYGNPYLLARNHDVRLDLAAVYARMGEPDRALSMLEQAQELVWTDKIVERLGNTAYRTLRDEPRYKAVLARSQLGSRLFSAQPIATPYKETLTDEEKIAGLSLFWAEVRQAFVWFDNVPDLDWNRVYVETIPKVLAAKTTDEYYRVLRQLAPMLRDGHTNIYPPRELQRQFFAGPPIRTAKVGDSVIVTAVRSASLGERVRVGDVVVAVDGVPAIEYAEQRVRPFVSGSTTQDRDMRTYSYQFLHGDESKPVSLTLRAADGKDRVEVVARKGYDDVKNSPVNVFQMRGDIAVISLDTFANDSAVKAFEAALPQILGAKGLVIDLRENGGGSSGYGLRVLSYLTRDALPRAKSRVRISRPNRRGEIDWEAIDPLAKPVEIKRDKVFAGPVAVLIGPQTFSAAEDMLVPYVALKRGALIGSASGGSTGQPMLLNLPGGGSARICAKRDSMPDGTEFVGRGFQPTVRVEATLDDIRAQRDAVLERAIAEVSR